MATNSGTNRPSEDRQVQNRSADLPPYFSVIPHLKLYRLLFLIVTFLSLSFCFSVPASARQQKLSAPALTAKCSGNRISFTWKKKKGIYAYRIYETNAAGTVHNVLKTTRKAHWRLSGAKAGQTYYYQIRGYKNQKNRHVWTQWGKPVKVVVPMPTPAPTPKPTPTPAPKPTPVPGPDPSTRRKFGSALAVMHAEDYGNLTRVRQAADKKYYAVECDYNYSGGVMWCYHTTPGSGTGTLQQTVQICKPAGSKVLIDLKTEAIEAMSALARYIKDNNLQKWVIVQTDSISTMQYLNAAVGSKLEYWGVLTSEVPVFNSLRTNASAYRSQGMTAINICRYIPGTVFTLGTQSNLQALRNAGYDICVFTFSDFTASEISAYTSYGAKYLMTNNMSPLGNSVG